MTLLLVVVVSSSRNIFSTGLPNKFVLPNITSDEIRAALAKGEEAVRERFEKFQPQIYKGGRNLHMYVCVYMYISMTFTHGCR